MVDEKKSPKIGGVSSFCASFVEGLKTIKDSGISACFEKDRQEEKYGHYFKQGIVENLDWDTYCGIKVLNPSTAVHGLHSMKRLNRYIKEGFDHDSDELRLGSGVHCLLLEPDEFRERFVVVPDYQNDPENLTKKGKRSYRRGTEYYDSKIAAFEKEHEGKTVLKLDLYKRALEMIESIRSHHEAPKYFTPDTKREVTLFGQICGVWFKGRLDLLNPNWFSDLKSTRTIEKKMFGRIFSRLGYGFKLSIYRELCRLNGFDFQDCTLVCQENTDDFDTCINRIPRDQLDNHFSDVKRVIANYKKSLKSGFFHGVDEGQSELVIEVSNFDMSDNHLLDYSGVEDEFED